MIEDITFEQITGALGSLLFLWAAIERQACADLAAANGGEVPKSAHGIDAALKAWVALVAQAEPAKGSLGPVLAAKLRKQLKPHLKIRNGLCHGLINASAGYHGQQASLSWELNGSTNRITWAELQAAFSWLSKVPRAMTMIAGQTAARLSDTPENRSWWKDEFGINLQGAAELERFAAPGGEPL